MKKQYLSFSKAVELLSDWHPVSYSDRFSRCCIFEVPMLSSVDIDRLSVYSGWYISCRSYVVEVILKNS